jgi:hypothetical protein
MLRRLLLTFSLIASFGIAQIGAVTHEISHYADASALNQQQDYSGNYQPDVDSIAAKNTANSAGKNNPATHGHTCEKCVGYAELGGAISSSHIALLLTSTSNVISHSQLQSFSATKPRTYSARAPPCLV